MNEEIKWLIGIGVTMVLAFGGMLIGSFRNLSARIAAGDDRLHERVNRVRDEYVRRDDLDGHLQRIDGNVNELRREIREGQVDTQRRLDRLLDRVSPPARDRDQG